MSKTSRYLNLPTLTIQESYGAGREIVLDRSGMIVGRDTDCDIFIDDRNVSRHHLRISGAPGNMIVEDLNSANGTFINSVPIRKKQIKHLDVIQIGSVMMVFNDPDNSGFGSQVAVEEVAGEGGYTFEFLRQTVANLEKNIAIVFKGKPEVIRNVIVCLFADGHLLIEDVPGVGKSILAQALAKSVQAQYRRIQFTPDMLPSDITGMNVYDEKNQTFKFLPGPIFGNVILADEINRTTPRTQSSLLECMSESVVTIDGKGHVLPKPFFVIATQNSEDYHGTYPLPEPQLDRFLMQIRIGYPKPEDELDILTSQTNSHPLSSISYVIKGTDVVHCQALVRTVKVSEQVKNYIIRIINETRVHPALTNGGSPRASLALMHCAQSLAAYRGRSYVTPKDVRDMLPAVLCHRLRLKLRYQAEWKSVANVLNAIVESVKLENEDPSA